MLLQKIEASFTYDKNVAHQHILSEVDAKEKDILDIYDERMDEIKVAFNVLQLITEREEYNTLLSIEEVTP